MKPKLPNIKNLASRARMVKAGNHEEHPRGGGGTQAAAPIVAFLHALPTWKRTGRCGWTG